MTDLLGWIATFAFVGSYFLRSPLALRSLQMAGAALWLIYGALIDAMPVIVANALVFLAAAWSSMGGRVRQQLPH